MSSLFLIGSSLGVLVGIGIIYYVETKYDREEKSRMEKVKEENRALIDTSRCASCSTLMGEDILYCSNCGFDMSKYKQ